MMKEAVGSRDPTGASPLASITVVLNWLEESKVRVPAK